MSSCLNGELKAEPMHPIYIRMNAELQAMKQEQEEPVIIQINLEERKDPQEMLNEIYARYRIAMTTCMQSMTETATQLACRNIPKSRNRRLKQKWRNLCAECGQIRKRMSEIEQQLMPL